MKEQSALLRACTKSLLLHGACGPDPKRSHFSNVSQPWRPESSRTSPPTLVSYEKGPKQVCRERVMGGSDGRHLLWVDGTTVSQKRPHDGSQLCPC